MLEKKYIKIVQVGTLVIVTFLGVKLSLLWHYLRPTVKAHKSV